MSATAGSAAARALHARAARRIDAFARGRWFKPLVFALALAPFLALVYQTLTGGLGANPIEALTDHTGELALRFLLISLALTPLRHLLGSTWPIRVRRMLGLFAFAYALLHVAVWSLLDQRLDVAAMVEDLLERPYILAGFVGFAILVPLAVTSTQRMARWLGRRWTSLHRWVYVASAAAVVHYVWLAKGDLIEPFVYLGILMVLFAARFAKLASAR